MAAVYQIDYTFDDPNSLINPVPLTSVAWDSSMIPTIAKTATTGCTFTIPTAPIWARIQLVSGTNPVRVVFTQYDKNHTPMVAKVPLT